MKDGKTKKPLLRPGLSTMRQNAGRPDVENKAGDVRDVMRQGKGASHPSPAGKLGTIMSQ
jgi:hypothetical protein